MRLSAKWIRPDRETKDVCPRFVKVFALPKQPVRAQLKMTALGVYTVRVNGRKVSEYVLAPGWTSYEKRLQVQSMDVSAALKSGGENEISVIVGRGWMRSPFPGNVGEEIYRERYATAPGLIAQLDLTFADGSCQTLITDASWQWEESCVRFSEIYDGEVFDASFASAGLRPCETFAWKKNILIPQEGEEIREIEAVYPQKIFTAPNGDVVVDFGQEVTGYIELSLTAHAGDRVELDHGEILDQAGNFYNENYRSAKAKLVYICREGAQTWHPQMTFYGFRYARIVSFPGEVKPENFRAIVVSSSLRRTGFMESGDELLGRLFSNVLWSQKGNFLDVPTDCPQRDERLGWTGDAQVFVKTASYNFDVERFFEKWLRDLAADQRPDGGIGWIIPDLLPACAPSAAWGDAAVICPWQIYQTYGNAKILKQQYDSMLRWVQYITDVTTTAGLWTGGSHFGDWLGLDAPSGSYKGSSRDDVIASAFYYHSVMLTKAAGDVLGKDTEELAALAERILKCFRETWPKLQTQTEMVLALHFGLCADKEATAAALAKSIRETGHMTTGFVGAPYLLYALSENGYTALAYDLLLRREYPSWLFSVQQGATTIWEHWDGIRQDGSFWSSDMNSFNHYAYGSAAGWIYEEAAGIVPLEAGFAKIRIAPKPDRRLGHLTVSINTRQGKVSSRWEYVGERIRYEITTPAKTQAVIAGSSYDLEQGSYTFWSEA